MNVKIPRRKSFLRLVASAVATVIAGFSASCGEITTTPIPRVMYGVVTSENQPLKGVTVSGGTTTVSSDTAGNYETVVPSGDCTIVFTKQGYADVSKSVAANAKSTIKADIAMTASSTPTPTPAPISGGGGGTSFTVTPGSYQRVQVTGPGKFSFTVVGINMDLDKDAWPIIFFYDGNGYTGGKGGSGGFNGDLRNYKLKFYDANGVIASESYYVQPKGNTPRWSSTVARNVTLEWGSGFVESTVDGIPFRKNAAVSGTFTLGIGFPPSIRSGWDGAVYSNIVWPAGSTKIP